MLQLRADLKISVHDDERGTFYVLEDPLRNKFFRLGLREYAILTQFDGRTAVGDVAQRGAARGDQPPHELTWDADEVTTVVLWAERAHLFTAHEALLPLQFRPAPVASRRSVNLFFFQLPLLRPGRWLDKFSPVARALFSRPGAALWLAVMLWGASSALSHWSQLATHATNVFHPSNWLQLMIVWCALKVWHELGHALACKRFGGEVHEAGIAFMFFAPVPYVDVTSAWRFPSKWQRIATSAAGMYFELFAAAVAALVCVHCESPELQVLAFNICVMASLQTVLANANPLMRFDGYFILADFAEIPNLASVARGEFWNGVRRFVFGQTVAASPWRAWQRWLVNGYGIGALVWQSMLCVTMSVILLEYAGRLGIFAATLFVIAFGLPQVVSGMKTFWQIGFHPRPRGWQLARFAMLTSGLVGLVGWCYCATSSLQAPAVVEYAPLVVVRAPAAGFVETLHVTDGQQVDEGDLVATLQNDELNLECDEIANRIEQCRVLEQSYAFKSEIAKQQIEAAKRAGLEKRREELAAQRNALKVFAPCRGRVLARDCETLLGRFLTIGAPLVMIGDDRQKEMLVAIPQDSCDAFGQQLNHAVEVRMDATLATRLPPVVSGRLSKIEPAAQQRLPHMALAGTVGGPIAVRPVMSPNSESSSNAGQPTVTVEPLRPILVGTIQLDPLTAGSLRAGQIGFVRLPMTGQSRLARFAQHAASWLQEKLFSP